VGYFAGIRGRVPRDDERLLGHDERNPGVLRRLSEPPIRRFNGFWQRRARNGFRKPGLRSQRLTRSDVRNAECDFCPRDTTLRMTRRYPMTTWGETVSWQVISALARLRCKL